MTNAAPEKGPYVPIGDRINQDVWHDNFVPKYSDLASARPKLVVIIGVWMIFGFTPIFATLVLVDRWRAPDSLSQILFESVFCLAAILISVAILYTQTRRFFTARSGIDPEDDDNTDEEFVSPN